MSLECSSAAWSLPLPTLEKITLLALSDWAAWPEYFVDPPMSVLLSLTGAHEWEIYQALGSLWKKDYVRYLVTNQKRVSCRLNFQFMQDEAMAWERKVGAA